MTILVDLALKFLREFEGCSFTAYQDAGGWAIGYGHREGVSPGDTCDQAHAESWLLRDLMNTCDEVRAVLSPAASSQISDSQLTAFCIFAFNVKNWKASEQLMRVNACDWADAAHHWLEYDHETIDGVKKQVPGLLRRRKAELQIFLGQTS